MGRIAELKEMIGQRRLGFRVAEEMVGTHQFEPGCGPQGRLPMRFLVSWGASHVGQFVNPFSGRAGVAELEGVVTVAGLCTDAPCRGSLELRYVTEQSIRYAFELEAQGTLYRYVGQKVNIWPWNLPVSHTTCFGTLVEAETGRLVSRSVTHFPLLSTARFMASFRLA